MRMTRWLFASLLLGALAFASSAAAQTSEGSTGTASSSPGVSTRNDSMTGAAIPGTAPVESRTLQPAQPGTARVDRPADADRSLVAGQGTPSGAYTDLSETGPQQTGVGSGAAGVRAPSRKLQEGLEKLHAGNQAEIQAGALAEQTAYSPEVKAFGQRMVTEHGQNDQHLVGIAQTMGVNLEGRAFSEKKKEAAKSMSKLHGKSGPAYDQAYIAAMIEDHTKDVQETMKLADQARKEGQPDLAAFLDQTVQMMQGHLAAAMQLQSKSASLSSSSTTGGTASSAGE